MKKIDHLLLILMEEGLEIGQAASKALRFGLYDDYRAETPAERIVYEINDLLGVIELLQENGIKLEGLYDRKQIEAKKEKVLKLFEYSKNKGGLND